MLFFFCFYTGSGRLKAVTCPRKCASAIKKWKKSKSRAMNMFEMPGHTTFEGLLVVGRRKVELRQSVPDGLDR